MRIDVLASAREAGNEAVKGKTAIVIDVLRATSNMAAGLAAGCSGIVPVETVEEALAERKPGDILGGERKCRIIPGFDIGNSPFEYADPQNAGRRIVMTTTNGTRALQLCRDSEHLAAGSLLNGGACARAALEWKRDTVLVCSGRDDVFSWEDGLGAGFIIHEMIRQGQTESLELGDFALAMLECWKSAGDRAVETILECSNGRRLCSLGFRGDILFCAGQNVYDLVPVYNGGLLVSHVPSRSKSVPSS